MQPPSFVDPARLSRALIKLLLFLSCYSVGPVVERRSALLRYECHDGENHRQKKHGPKDAHV